MKNICFFLYDLKMGGAEKVIVNLANHLAKKGYDVSLLTVNEGNDLEDLINPDVKVETLGKDRIISSLPRLIHFLRQNHFNYFVPNVWPITIISFVTRIISRKTQMVFIEHCNLTAEFSNRNFFFKLFQNISIFIFYRLAHKVITVSGGVKDDLLIKGVPRNKLEVIYNPRLSINNNDPKDPIDIDKWVNSPEKKIICVGELKKQKNFSNLIKAIGILHNKFKIKSKVLILGDGIERDLLENLIEKEDLNDHIFLPGWVKSPIPFLEMADLFVLSSDYEGFGVVIAEALSTGLNVVSTDCKSGPREILNDGELGTLCEVDNPGDLAEGIYKSLENPKDKEILLRRAEDFSMDNIGKQYEKIFT
tara:strand:- start:1248 stop:2336 length:1089 start_codon:yes stop_codon:yes gene_type:complete